MIKAIIIDDEPDARENLINMVTAYAEQVEIIGEAEDVEAGISAIDLLNPDLVFLDIKMPDGTGFDLLKKIENLFESHGFSVESKKS